ncbi:hypothetical protein KXV85_000752, partial [Aspergillus fumigatus]
LWDRAGELRLAPVSQVELGKLRKQVLAIGRNINQAVHAMNAANQPGSTLEVARIAAPFLETCGDLKALLMETRRAISSYVGGEGASEMSFRLSSGTLDSMAGVLAPPKRYRLGTGGGKGKRPQSGGAIVSVMAAAVAPRTASVAVSLRPDRQVKHAFGGGSPAAVSGRAIATMERTARRVPEVMVRATGRQHGGGHVLANFSYISRLVICDWNQFELYTSDEEVLHDARDMQVLAQDWQEWERGGDARRKGATSISMILSMPAGTDPERL